MARLPLHHYVVVNERNIIMTRPRPGRTSPVSPPLQPGEDQTSYEIRLEEWRDENRPPAPPVQPTLSIPPEPPPPPQNPGFMREYEEKPETCYGTIGGSLFSPLAEYLQEMFVSINDLMYVVIASRFFFAIPIFALCYSTTWVILSDGSNHTAIKTMLISTVTIGMGKLRIAMEELDKEYDRIGTDAPPPQEIDEMGKSKSPSKLIEQLLDQAMAGHKTLAVEVWNDFGWVVDIGDCMGVHWRLTKKNVKISDCNAIMIDGHEVWTRYNQKIYVPGVWVQYVLADLKEIAAEVQTRIKHARRVEKVKVYLAVREKRERTRLIEQAVNDVALFAGWDDSDMREVSNGNFGEV